MVEAPPITPLDALQGQPVGADISLPPVVVDTTIDSAAAANQPAAPATPDATAPALPTKPAEQVRAPEAKRVPDAKEMMDANTAVVRALALAEYRRKPPASNEAQKSLAVLGEILSIPNGKKLSAPMQEAFKPTEGLPRIMEVKGPDGAPAYVSSYDRRASDEETDATPIAKGEHELTTYTGRGEDGRLGFICDGENDDDKRNILLTDVDFIKLYLVAQRDPIKTGLAAAADGSVPFAGPSALADAETLAVFAKQVENVDGFVTQMVNLRKKDAAADVDLVADITPEQMVAALEQTSVSAKSVRTFADNMRQLIGTDAWGGSTNDRATFLKEIDDIRDALENGLQPTAAQLHRLMVMAALPKLDAQEQSAEQEIKTLKAAGKDTAELERGLQSLRDFRSGGADSIYRQYLDAVIKGEVNPEDAAWLNDQLIEVRDPWSILGDHNPLDEKCLAGKAFAHLKRGLDDDQVAKVEAWLTKFFKDHGSDIAMMGIFALFQMMTTMIGDAARGAH